MNKYLSKEFRNTKIKDVSIIDLIKWHFVSEYERLSFTNIFLRCLLVVVSLIVIFI